MDIYFVDECTSVLDVARERIAEGLMPVGSAVLAKRQTAGRGQYGRKWEGKDGNVYLAVRLPAKAPFDSTAGALAVAYLVTETLGMFGFSSQIKWRNDVMIGGCKAAGMLIEQRGESFVAGIGVNVTSHPGEELMREGAAAPAISLSAVSPEKAKAVTPEKFTRVFLEKLGNIPETFAERLSALAAPKLLWLNEAVEFAGEDGKVTDAGYFRGVGVDGLALIESAGNVRSVMRGSMRKFSR